MFHPAHYGLFVLRTHAHVYSTITLYPHLHSQHIDQCISSCYSQVPVTLYHLGLRRSTSNFLHFAYVASPCAVTYPYSSTVRIPYMSKYPLQTDLKVTKSWGWIKMIDEDSDQRSRVTSAPTIVINDLSDRVSSGMNPRCLFRQSAVKLVRVRIYQTVGHFDRVASYIGKCYSKLT